MSQKKNIIICCDGTGNQLGETYSNVIKLYMCLEKDPEKQLVFYDPGVGTLSDPNVVTPLYKGISKIGGLAFGWGLKMNVQEAYTYLMNYYSPGDDIYMFGFSRGAYTVRVLAGMIHAVGLLTRGSSHLFPYAWKTYKQCIGKGVAIGNKFKSVYAQSVPIHFVGVWDTVSSVGVFGLKVYPNTATNESIRHIRHAISIDEQRTYYRQNVFNETKKNKSIRQVWFAGVHSDVGGSYPLNESGLAQLSLEWMMDEAIDQGLNVNYTKRNEVLYDSLGKGESVPDHRGNLHRSLSLFWWTLECLPKLKRSLPFVRLPAFGKTRNMHRVGIPVVHWSVIDRLKDPDSNYNPGNLVGKEYTIEEKRRVEVN